MEHKVMNCKDFEAKRFKGGAQSPKVDGVRGYFYPGQDELVSRTGKPIRGMGHIVTDLWHMDHVVDMELSVPGKEFNEVSGIVRNHNYTPEVKAYVIDIVTPGPISERLKLRPPETSNIICLPNYRVKSLNYFWDLHKRFMELGYEGSVIKTFGHEYRNNRSYDWMREVPIKSEDCICLGVYEGKGKMMGIAGGIYIDFMGIECKCGTMKGLNYNDRKELLINADYYTGHMCEIQYKNLQPSGKPRQPRFKGWRWDK